MDLAESNSLKLNGLHAGVFFMPEFYLQWVLIDVEDC
jgi:hypothetical protein